MKTVRIWFLLLLAVLLPLRGAVAAAMLCPVGSSGMRSELRDGQHADHHDMDHHEVAHDHGSTDDHEGHDHGVVDKCNMCSAFCSLTPLVSDTPKLPEPAALPAFKFADFATPALTFLSDRQERPPRTI